jgi:hypothetical protein
LLHDGPLLRVSVSRLVATVVACCRSNGGGAALPLRFPVRLRATWLSRAGLGTVVQGTGSIRPMMTGWVQPPHKIHIGAE